MRLVPGWATRSLHLTFGGRGGIMTTAWQELPYPCYIPQVIFVYKSQGREFSKGEVMSWREVRLVSISNQPCCRASFYSDAVWCNSLRGSQATCMWLVPGWMTSLLHVTLVTSISSFLHNIFKPIKDTNHHFSEFYFFICSCFEFGPV